MNPLIFGGAALSGEEGGYGFGKISNQDAVALLHAAYERGIRLYDSAPIYGFGESEKRMGKAFQNREDVFLISKSGVTWNESRRVDMSNEPRLARAMLEQSLRNFRRDIIDLYMVHWPDARVDIRQTLEFFMKAKEEGKIRHIGLCNTSPEELQKAREVAPIEYIQSEFHLFFQEPPEIFSHLENAVFMSWGTLDKGILTKRVSRQRELSKDYDSSDCRRKAPWWKQSEVLEKLDRLEPLWAFLQEKGHTPLELALGHNLSWIECSHVLVGMKNCEQLDQVLSALEKLPTQEIISEARKIVNS